MADYYDRDGNPVAYSKDGEHVFLFTGEPVGYFDGDSIYSFSGKHLGWKHKGWIIDNGGKRVFFTKSSKGGPATPARKAKPAKSVRKVKPVKRAKRAKPAKPSVSNSWSQLSGEAFFDQ